jgi:hypothetical protein
LTTTFTSSVAMTELIVGMISSNSTSRQISGPKSCPLITHHLQPETATQQCSTNVLFTYLAGTTDLFVSTTSTSTALIKASGPCNRCQTLRPGRVQGTLIAQSFITIKCTFLVAMMVSTEMTFIDSTSARTSGSKYGGMDSGPKVDTEHLPPWWDSECICLEVTTERDS